MHIAYGHKYDLKTDDTPPAEYEPILGRTTATEAPITTDTETATPINTSLPEQDETTPLIQPRRQAIDSGKIFVFLRECP
jgi:hypothetical protein